MFCVFLRTEGSVRTDDNVVLDFLDFIVVSKGPISKLEWNMHVWKDILLQNKVEIVLPLERKKQ